MSAQARRALVGMLMRRGISGRRACVLLSVARSTLGYVSRQSAKDVPFARLLRGFARRHPRHGYRRAWVWLRRRGYRVNRKRVYRLWCQAGLALPQRRAARRRWRGPRVDPVARAPTAVWAADILHTSCGRGQVVRCLCVVDEYTRECLAIEVASSLPAERVVRCLALLVEEHGAPEYLRTDNGTEFLARRTQQWLRHHGIQSARIEPGKPWQNGVVESFHSRLRDECVDREWFGSVAEAAVIIEQYRQHYNATRPHSSLNYRTPAEVRTEYDTMVDTGVEQPRRREMATVSL